MSKEHLSRLLQAVSGASRVLILPHNDPDPDAIASAVALRYLLEEGEGITAEIVYQGIIGRAENKALVRYLDRPLRRLTLKDLKDSPAIALVDTQPGAGNNPLPASTPVQIVLDHHPLREETTTARFVDHRINVGATSTILTEYLQAAEIEPPAPLATALFYGIKTDTMSLGRGATAADMEAYFYLQSRLDSHALFEIERAQVPADYFKSFAKTLQAARVYKDVVIAYTEEMSYPGMAAEMADLLLRLEGVEWVICMGVYQKELILSVRKRDEHGGAGQLAQTIINSRGTAGGHGMMAGGQVPLNGDDPKKLAAEISRNALQYLLVADREAGDPLI